MLSSVATQRQRNTQGLKMLHRYNFSTLKKRQTQQGFNFQTVDDSLFSFFTAEKTWKEKAALLHALALCPHSSRQQSLPIPSLPTNDHFLIWSPLMMISHNEYKPVSSKNRLKLNRHSCNAVHSLFFFLLLFLFVTWDVYSESKLFSMLGVYRATCWRDISLWGSNLRPAQSLDGMYWVCQHSKCRLVKCALCLFPVPCTACWRQHLLYQHVLLYRDNNTGK